MSFLRPEAKAELWRWREVLGGIAVALIGLWLVAGPGLCADPCGGDLCLDRRPACAVSQDRPRGRSGTGG